MPVVYVALCVPNEKLYFGITCGSLRSRRQRHVREALRGSPFHFHRALKKYGSDNFVWYEIGHITRWRDACEVERMLIGYFDTTHTGYNMGLGGEGSFGSKLTPETKLKLSAAVSRTMTPEHRAHLAAKHLGNKASLETRVKQSDAHVGQVRTPEARAKMSAAMQQYSEEFKAEAVAHATVHGFRAAGRAFGLPHITIQRWTWSPERLEIERLKMLARAKIRDAEKRTRLLSEFSSCATGHVNT